MTHVPTCQRDRTPNRAPLVDNIACLSMMRATTATKAVRRSGPDMWDDDLSSTYMNKTVYARQTIEESPPSDRERDCDTETASWLPSPDEYAFAQRSELTLPART